ncbi:MAG: DNA polymerase/3'-5' exonuclease PolX [Bacteroidales bacterium]
MPVHNKDIAEIFNKIANLLEIKGANQFRVRAYRDAARTMENLSKTAADMVKQDEDLSELPGIGKDLADKVETIVETGTHPLLEDLKKEIPEELSRLMRLKGMGPKKIKALFNTLGVKTADDLRKAAETHKIKEISGFGEVTEKNILEELDRWQGEQKRSRLSVADQMIKPYFEYLKGVKKVKSLEIVGSYRRRKETVGDIDILATCKRGCNIMEHFTAYEDVGKVLSKGKTRSTVILKSGLQVDLRVVSQVAFGAAMHYFTGSKAHNIACRKIAVNKKFKLNEYGLFKGDNRIAGRTEKEVYAKLNLPYIQPELRENRGEIEAGQKGKLPELIALDDLRGDLHVHTKATDGRNSLEEIAEAAQKKGYEYLAITDHSKKVSVARGLDVKRLRKQIEEINRLQDKFKDIRILKSIEVDILKNGSLDLPDDVLKELDLTVCSVHYNLNLSREKQTERILKAMDNPYMNILGHPSGRMINKREPLELDMEKIMQAAAERNICFEINSDPDRLDLNDVYCKLGKEIGIKMVISTDAHSVENLDLIRFGISQARRGWLEKDDVLNTLSWKKLKKALRRK